MCLCHTNASSIPTAFTVAGLGVSSAERHAVITAGMSSTTKRHMSRTQNQPSQVERGIAKVVARRVRPI